MEFFEKDLEEIIYLSDKEKLSDKGLYLHGILKRQFKIGNYGIADLVEISLPRYDEYFKCKIKGVINILELKKDKIGVSTFFQAINYLQGIKTYLNNKDKEHLFNYKITLIGREIDLNSSFCYLGDLFCNSIYDDEIFQESKIQVELYKYSYGIDGIEFKEISNYNLTNKGF
jgi:hypothetical protein